jgi:hypothetical protein
MRWIALSAALVLLDAPLTFENVWPTPAVRWHGTLSIELVVCLFGMAILSRWSGPPSRAAVAWLSAMWTVLVIGRYAEVTAPALYGRDINLYWDLRFIPDVVAMVTRVAPAWLVVLSTAAAALLLAMLHRVLGWAWRRVGSAMADEGQRRALIVLSAAALVLFVGPRVSAQVPGGAAFATPVTRTYVRQVRIVTEALAGSTTLAESPAMNGDLSLVQGTDVFIIFVESYGAVSYERPEIARPLAAALAQFEAAIRQTRRDVVSAYVESPTFGGSSWLAHISLLSGIEVRDPDTNAKLMTANRDTLVRAFSRRGFRTVALMPGLRQTWPEGAFYGFDEIYGADRLAYRGPEFGWFAIPDQFSLDRLDALEVGRPSRPPLFVFFPTISTHFPFSPTPPYQPDWRRIWTARPYDGPEIVSAYARQPDWTDFRPGYVDALSYDLASIGGYLRKQADRDFVMVVLGDHQPLAAVSGERAPWDVPVHVISSHTAVLDRLRGDGFRTGLTPARPAIGRMHALVPVLLQAFGDTH